MPVPTQLKQWNEEVQAVKRRFPQLTHAQALKVASKLREAKPASRKPASKKPASKKSGKGIFRIMSS